MKGWGFNAILFLELYNSLDKLILVLLFVLILPVSGIVAKGGGLEGVLVSLLPLGWAGFSVLINVLEGMDESEDFFYVSTDWEVAVGSVSQSSIAINDESSSK